MKQLLLAAGLLTAVVAAPSAQAIETAAPAAPSAKLQSQPATPANDHGLKIGSKAGAKMDKLANTVTRHTKNAARTTEKAVKHAAQRTEQVGRKVGTTLKNAARRFDEKVDKLTE